MISDRISDDIHMYLPKCKALTAVLSQIGALQAVYCVNPHVIQRNHGDVKLFPTVYLFFYTVAFLRYPSRRRVLSFGSDCGSRDQPSVVVIKLELMTREP